MSTVSGILLAAGESRRMGGINKLMLPVDGMPLLRRTVLTLQASRLADLVVVLGHRADEARTALAGLDVTLVDNPFYAEGQMSSVHCALAALPPCDGVMVCLADQPLLTAEDVDALIDAYEAAVRADGEVIVVPVHAGRRGNPIVLSYAHREVILRGERNLGCKRLIERHPEQVRTVPASHRVVFDLDTPEDYARLQQLAMRRPPASAA